jgi:hypothetical protein
MDFRCCYCNRGFITFEEVIHHSIEDHPLQELQYKFIRLDVATGKKQICTKVYGFSPNECFQNGSKITVTPENKVRVEDDPNFQKPVHSENVKTVDKEIPSVSKSQIEEDESKINKALNISSKNWQKNLLQFLHRMVT